MIDLGYVESLEPLDRSNDIEHGVHCPDLVQVHPLGGDTVHAPLGVADQSKCSNRGLTHSVRKGRAFHKLHQLSDVTTMRLGRNRKLDLLAANTGTTGVSNCSPDPFEAEPCRQPFEPRTGQPE